MNQLEIRIGLRSGFNICIMHSSTASWTQQKYTTAVCNYKDYCRGAFQRKAKAERPIESQHGEANEETSRYLTCLDGMGKKWWHNLVRFVNNLNWRSREVLGHSQVFLGTIIVTHVDAEVFEQWPVAWPIQHYHPIISLRKGQKQPCMTQHEQSLLFISVPFQCNQSFSAGWHFVHIAWMDVKIFCKWK